MAQCIKRASPFPPRSWRSYLLSHSTERGLGLFEARHFVKFINTLQILLLFSPDKTQGSAGIPAVRVLLGDFLECAQNADSTTSIEEQIQFLYLRKYRTHCLQASSVGMAFSRARNSALSRFFSASIFRICVSDMITGPSYTNTEGRSADERAPTDVSDFFLLCR